MQDVRELLPSLRQTTVMAAIVATLLCVPAGALLALFSFLLLGVSVQSFVTFGDTFHAVAGLVVWWLIAFVPAFGYAAFALPRSGQ